MIGPDKVLAIIPARAGSKRLPGKNTAILDGLPLIVRTILQAKESRYIDTIAVTTDDPKAADMAFRNGADVVIVRPAELATDEARTEDAILHAMGLLSGHDVIVLLQVTSPLREVEDIDACIEMGVDDPCFTVSGNLVNGAVYVWPSKLIGGVAPLHYEMPPSRSIDIDTWDDFKRARDALSVHSIMGG